MGRVTHFKNIAFISYNHNDVAVAKWMHRKLGRYRLPSKIQKEYPDVPTRLRKIFRDQDELAPGGGTLTDKIKEQLQDSKFLIVICTHNATKSTWVESEIKYYINELGRGNFIIPYIPDSKNDLYNKTDIFPPSLLQFSQTNELYSIQESENGKKHAFIKVVSGLLELDFGILWDVFEKLEKRKKIITWISLFICMAFLLGIAKFMYSLNYHSILEESKILAHESKMQLTQGNIYIAEMLAFESYKNHPYSPESEAALRAVFDTISSFNGQYKLVETIKYKDTPKITGFHHREPIFIVIHNRTVEFYDSNNCEKKYSLKLSFEPEKAKFSYNGTLLYVFSKNILEVWDFKKKQKVFPARATNESLNIIDVTDWFIIVQDKNSNNINFINKTGLCVRDSIPCDVEVDESAYNLQNNLLAISGKRGGARVFNCNNGNLIYREHPDCYVDKFSFSPYGKYLYINKLDSISKYTIEDCKITQKYSYENKEGATLYSCSDTNDFWGFAGGDIIEVNHGYRWNKFNAHRSNITDISLNQDKTKILTCSEDNSVKIWVKDFHQYTKSIGYCQSVNIDIDKCTKNHCIVSSSSFGYSFVSVFEINSQKPVCFRTDISSYNSPKFANDGKNVIYNRDGRFYIWNYKINLVTDSICLEQENLSNNWNVSPKGDKIAASAIDTFLVYSINERKLLKSIAVGKRIEDLRFSTDGKLLGILTEEELLIYDIKDFSLVESYYLEDYVKRPYFPYGSNGFFIINTNYVYLLCREQLFCIERDSRNVCAKVYCSGKKINYEEISGKLVLHDNHKLFVYNSNLKFCQIVDIDYSYVNNVLFIDDNMLLSASDKIRWWSLASFPFIKQDYAFSYTSDHEMFYQTNEHLASWKLLYPHYIWYSDFNKERNKVVITSSKGIHIVNGITKNKTEYEYECDSIQSSVFFNSDKVYYRKIFDKNLYEWDYKHRTHKIIARFPNVITSLAPTQKKDILAVGLANSLYLIDQDGKVVKKIPTTSDVMSIEFSNNDEYVVITLFEGVVKVIRLNDSKILASITGKKDYTKTAVFVNNRQIATIIDDSTWGIYDIETRKEIARYTIDYNGYNKLYGQFDSNYGIFRLNEKTIRYPNIETVCNIIKASMSGRTFSEDEKIRFGIKNHLNIWGLYF